MESRFASPPTSHWLTEPRRLSASQVVFSLLSMVTSPPLPFHEGEPPGCQAGLPLSPPPTMESRFASPWTSHWLTDARRLYALQVVFSLLSMVTSLPWPSLSLPYPSLPSLLS